MFSTLRSDGLPVDDNVAPTPSTSSLDMELKNTIESVSTTRKITCTDTTSQIQKELNFFDAIGTRSPKLEKLMQALITIQPTSTRSERVFSVAGCFSTKIRNRLTYKMLNSLVFLKYYFLNEKCCQ